jgi:hypothetical protein
MPTPATIDLPPPKSEEAFEDLATDALKHRLGNPYLVRFGRRGQRQRGIDGHDPSVPRARAIVWQSTLRGDGLLRKIEDDLAEMDADPAGQPESFIVTIGQRRDATIQTALRDLTDRRIAVGKCPVVPFFWDDLLNDILSDQKLTLLYFPFLAPTPEADSGLSDEDLRLLAALDERDDPEEWVSLFEVAVRTKVPARDLNDAVDLLTRSGHIDSRPFGPNERSGSPFTHQRIRLLASGRRTLKPYRGRIDLAGLLLPRAVNVALDYPDNNPRLALEEQKKGFSISWQYESYLIDREEPFDPIVREIQLRPARLETREQAGTLLLVRNRLPEITAEYARELLKRSIEGAVFLQREKDGDWEAKRIESVRGPGDGPPAVTYTKVLGRSETLYGLLAELGIRIPV